MSYSLNAKAATPDDLAAELRSKYAEMAQQQPVHAKEQEAVCSMINLFCGMLEPGCPKGYEGALSGTLSWNGPVADNMPERFNHCNAIVSVGRAY